MNGCASPMPLAVTGLGLTWGSMLSTHLPVSRTSSSQGHSSCFFQGPPVFPCSPCVDMLQRLRGPSKLWCRKAPPVPSPSPGPAVETFSTCMSLWLGLMKERQKLTRDIRTACAPVLSSDEVGRPAAPVALPGPIFGCPFLDLDQQLQFGPPKRGSKTLTALSSLSSVGGSSSERMPRGSYSCEECPGFPRDGV